jgi:uncharacterized membrane protein YedE/YeeE
MLGISQLLPHHPTLFTPLHSSVGGTILAASVYFFSATLGRVLGISGIIAKSLKPSTSWRERLWRLTFIAGLVVGGWAMLQVPGLSPTQSLASTGNLLLFHPYAGDGVVMGVAGLFVGLGTQIGSGCTSGHGLCGLSRLSPRSWIATPTFVLAGMLTTWAAGTHLLSYTPISPWEVMPVTLGTGCTLLAILAGEVGIFALVAHNAKALQRRLGHDGMWVLVSALTGFFFGTGLVMSGMTDANKVLGFLSLIPYLLGPGAGVAGTDAPDQYALFDPSLLLVMGCGVALNLVLFQTTLRKRKVPLVAKSFDFPTRKDITPALVLGSTLFGIGWGLGGICPGPSLVAWMVDTGSSVTIWTGGFVLGVALTLVH